MGRKKNVQDLSIEDRQFIEEKMGYESSLYKIDYKTSSPLNYKIDLKCKNQKQKEFYNLIKEKEVIFCSGSAGTGKSYIALTAALELLKNSDNPYTNIMLIIQTVQADLDLGYLKGNILEKIQPFCEPILYTMKKILRNSNNTKSDKEILDNLIKSNYITYNHVAFLRGVNIDNSIVIIDESQQYTKSAMKTILTRIGENSKYIFLGDVEQCDNKELKKSKEENGLKFCIRKFKNFDRIGSCEFTNEDIVRNPLISLFLENWD
jgi:phosphate starvation-inducible PhoH-like protein